MLGFAVDTADTAISFMHNDGVGCYKRNYCCSTSISN
jgi:hypothetical protein